MLDIQEDCIEKINIKELDVLTFNQLYLLRGKPAIITNLFDQIPSLSFCSPDELSNKLGNKLVKINRSSDGIFRLDPKSGNFEHPPIVIGFKEYIDKINSNETLEKLYMQQVPIREELPELMNHLKFPQYINLEHAEEINLWVGPGGNTSPLHYDQANNFFIQLYGLKSFWLSDPMQFYKLYPNSCFSKARHMSKINLNNPNTNQYPKLLKAKFAKITLHPGEMLFLPAFWWHQVYSIDTTVSINIWCSILWRQRFTPGALHNLLNKIYYSSKKLVMR